MLPLAEHCRLPEDVLEGLAHLKIRLVGLPAEAAHKFPSQLSGGMVKRAALARALALDPPLLHVDTGDAAVDAMLSGYTQVHVAPGQRMVMRVAAPA